MHFILFSRSALAIAAGALNVATAHRFRNAIMETTVMYKERFAARLKQWLESDDLYVQKGENNFNEWIMLLKLLF
jgi:glycosyltransferase A (GT-A) superfamily protein (DUF2064 family)